MKRNRRNNMYELTAKPCVNTQAEEKKKKAIESPNGHIFRIKKSPFGLYEEGAVFFVFAPQSVVRKQFAIYLEKQNGILSNWDDFKGMIEAGVVFDLITEDVEFRFIYEDTL
jgi:hypothetical protein